MGLRSCLFALFIMVGACGVDSSPPDESAVDQQLTASEIDSSWFTDAAFTNQVGESDLLCSGGKYQTGQINTKYVARFTWPCSGAGGHKVTCYQYQQPSCTGCSGSYTVVACPAGLF